MSDIFSIIYFYIDRRFIFKIIIIMFFIKKFVIILFNNNKKGEVIMTPLQSGSYQVIHNQEDKSISRRTISGVGSLEVATEESCLVQDQNAENIQTPRNQEDINLRILVQGCEKLGHSAELTNRLAASLSGRGIKVYKTLAVGSQSIVYLISLPEFKPLVVLKLCRFDPDSRTLKYSNERMAGEMIGLSLEGSKYLVETHEIIALNDQHELEYIETPPCRDTDNGVVIGVIQECFPNAADLYQRFVKGEVRDPKVYHTIMTAIAEGLSNLHSVEIAHRDVKPENILVDAEGRIKLIDFGFFTEKDRTNSRLGTPHYIAPEVVFADRQDYDPKLADAYSFAMVLFLLRFNAFPFPILNQEQEGGGFDYMGYFGLLHRAFQDESRSLKDYISEDVKPRDEKDAALFDLIAKLGCINPKNRWSIEQALKEHPYFRS